MQNVTELPGARRPRRRRNRANGRVPLRAPGWKGAVWGGPWSKRIMSLRGVCLLERPGASSDMLRNVQSDRDLYLPIRDFSVPDDPAVVNRVLRQVIKTLILEERAVYIGCMGGIGRTGMITALLVKTFSIGRDPVRHVRENMHPQAVETKEQKKYVRDFDVSGLQMWVSWYLLWRGWRKRLRDARSALSS